MRSAAPCADRSPGSINGKPAAILFDFDGVLVESEYEESRRIAAWLTDAGRPITALDAAQRFAGYAGAAFLSRVEGFYGAPLPRSWHDARAEADARVMEMGIDPVAGAAAFVRSLPDDLPRAIVSSSSTAWIDRHLRHSGLRDAFGEHLYSGREHVTRGKPAPDLYLHAAAALGVPIAACAIIEDSVVGATGAVASGGRVIGLCAGRHCDADHADRLRAVGVAAIAADFGEVARLLS